MSEQPIFSEGQHPSSGAALSPEDKEIEVFNNTAWNGYDPQATLVSLFKQQVECTPGNTGISFRDQSLTYRELDEKSDRLAGCLTAKGVKPGHLVPVWMDRSADWFVAILGILKTGAAYVPVDPHYPPKRALYIIEDTGAGIVIADRTLGEQLPREMAAVVWCTDDITAAASSAFSPVSVTPDMLAYVIYTSGSTGQPKGVMVTHRAIQHLITWHNQHFEVDETCRLTLVAGLAFDISVWEVWSALLSGATLHVAGNSERIDVNALWQYFLDNRITHGFVPPVLAPAIVECSKRENSPSLRYLFTGGEQLKPVLTSGLTYELIDYYGPTECTVFATYRRVRDENGAFVSSIGRPIANTRAYVLNEQLEMLPVGTVGELCISGIGLSSGYLNNKEQTREKFTDHPFLSGKKLYRTGDLARWLPEGRIQFLGRKDHQLKIRGFRVEPGEIERCLLDIPGIENAVVMAKENKSNNKYLVAFIAGSDGASLPEREHIQAVLREELPEYMVPGHFITVDRIPLTENGKTDRNRLLRLAEEQLQEVHLSAPPANATERSIAGVWCEALELAAVNVSDNFFDIGGDSILVAFVITEIEKRLGVKAYVRDIYQHPTIRELAVVLDRRKEEALLPEEDMEPYVELQRDVYLNPETVISGDYDKKNLAAQQSVLLTGATGFVGIHLLQDLLKGHPSATVYCLVRAHDKVRAMEKIMQTFSRYNIGITPEQKERIIPVPGDFSRKKLGFDKETYDTLSRTVDVIYHSGSSVNFIEPYSYMKSPNVDGVREIIHLAATQKTKCLVLLSTISIYSWGHVFTDKTVMKENDGIAQNLESVSRDIGYVRSKWVMEAIADLAASKGLPVITHRLGYAMCNSETGACAPYQWWAGLVKTCIQSGNYPALDELREGLITVDYMTRAIVHISKNPEAIGKKFNLIARPETNLTLEDFFRRLKDYYAFDLEPLPYKDWRKQWENDANHPLYPLTSLFKDNMYKGLSTVELYQHTYIWDCQNVTDFLKGSGIEEPVFDRRILDKYLQFLNLYPVTSD
ncbi:amino acid adenylation domain-containing protein [Sinomicrobium kalidii]|uniref:non-ribosomal peptide synthetase family protein n=1 Tax=Sinomicrobium kalidii TaxID=2900738 RepID=UPI001E40604B|nr:non-ribosomal peptide synthetase [Sinomicrobium kalidii]UGU17854.1 amino acid adenylation domain-containing protein [Sinomicrobium kalidii]